MKIHPSAVAITAALIVASVLLAPSRAHACTLYAAAGTAVDDGGVMMSKVRDWRPSEETLVRVTPKPGEGYAYVGLATGKYQNFNMGVNEKGLALGLSTAGSIPKKERLAMPHFRSKDGFTSPAYLLRHCAMVEEAIRATEAYVEPVNFILADKTEAAVIEVMPGGKRTVKRIKTGTIAHTNHYIEPESEAFNQKIGKSSEVRLARIKALLADSTSDGKTMTFDAFKALGHDRNAGPDHSIWRTGSQPDGTQTVAYMAVKFPKAGGYPILHLEWRTKADDPASLQVIEEPVTFNR